MAAAKPWMKFYPRDWRADEKLRDCSLAARGLWIEMLAIMHASERYGRLLVAGKAPTAASLARQVGAAADEVEVLLDELREADVFSTDASGIIYSRRMKSDEKRAENARKVGKRGGNPRLLKQSENSAQDKVGDNGTLKAGDKPRVQSPDSVDKSTGGEGPPIDPVKAMFDAGVALLTGAGVPDKQARSLIGKWRGQVGDDEVRLAIGEAQIARISDPVPWLSRRCAPKGKAPTNPDDAYRQRTIEDIRQRREFEERQKAAVSR